jgi:hypothetical protein
LLHVRLALPARSLLHDPHVDTARHRYPSNLTTANCVPFDGRTTNVALKFSLTDSSANQNRATLGHTVPAGNLSQQFTDYLYGAHFTFFQVKSNIL